jgi:predicted small lipoprotein YifL
MANKTAARAGLCAPTLAALLFAMLGVMLGAMLGGCGQKGPLYLPDAASDVVTRPAVTTPPEESTSGPNSPQTADSPPAPPSPTPEVTAPAGTPEAGEPKKEKGATTPPQK